MEKKIRNMTYTLDPTEQISLTLCPFRANEETLYYIGNAACMACEYNHGVVNQDRPRRVKCSYSLSPDSRGVEVYELVGVIKNKENGTQVSYETTDCPSLLTPRQNSIEVLHIQPVPDIKLEMGLPDHYIMTIDDEIKMVISVDYYTDQLFWKKVVSQTDKGEEKSND